MLTIKSSELQLKIRKPIKIIKMAKVRKRTSPKFQTTPETVNETPNDRNCDDGPSQSNDERGNAFLNLLT